MSDEEIVSLNRMKLFARSSDLSVVTAKDMNIVVNLVEKQKEKIKELQAINQTQKYRIEVMDERELISRDEVENIIKVKIEEYEEKFKAENGKKTINYHLYRIIIDEVLKPLLDKIKGDDKQMNDEERKAENQLKADTNFYDYELKNGNYVYELFKILNDIKGDDK